MHTQEAVLHHLSALLGDPESVTSSGVAKWVVDGLPPILFDPGEYGPCIWLPQVASDGLPQGTKVCFAGIDRPEGIVDAGGSHFAPDREILNIGISDDGSLGEALRFLKGLRNRDPRLPARFVGAQLREGLIPFLKGLGVARYIPGLSALGNAANDAVAIVEGLDRHAQARRVRRCESMLHRLEHEFAGLEVQLNEHTRGWFRRIFESAIADDEQQKEVFYSAVLQWLATESPSIAHIRVLSEAVEELAYAELCAIIHEAEGDRLRTVATRFGFEEDFLLERLQRYSLIPGGGVRVDRQQTQFAKVLTARIHVTDLEE